MADSGSRRLVTMADVARIVGVSVTTVSHVVNKSRPVSSATEAAVLRAIAEAGYVPDQVVRSMRTTGTQTIGLAMAAISNPYFGEVVHSIELAVSRAGYSLILADTHDDAATELRAVSDLLRRSVEAIVLAPSQDPSAAIAFAQGRGVPVVLIDRFVDADVDQIASESTDATTQLVDHLAKVCGHRRIAMITGHPGLTTTEDRIQGYRAGLKKNRVRFRPEYTVSGDSSDDGATRALTELMALDQPPTAVVVGNNRMTIGVMRAARDAGIRVPEDLALVAFDDFEWADLFHPRLTVIAQPIHAMGEQAAGLVFSRLASPSTPPRKVMMQPTFMHRESCGCH
jgi:LacI family transcriptional regulator